MASHGRADANHLPRVQSSETIFILKPADPAQRGAGAHLLSRRRDCPSPAIRPSAAPSIWPPRSTRRDVLSETVIRLEEVAGLVPVKVSRIGDVPRAQFTAPVVPLRAGRRHAVDGEIARALGLSEQDIGFGAHRPRLLQGGPRAPSCSACLAGRAGKGPERWSRTGSALVTPLGTDIGYLYTPAAMARTHRSAPACSHPRGIPEDPATGSATAILAAQLLDFEASRNGTHRWRLEQGYEMGRPSDLWLEAMLQVRNYLPSGLQVRP